MTNFPTDIDREPPVSEGNSSQSPLLGEHDEGQDIGTCISRSEQTDFLTSENSSEMMNENMAGNDAEDFHAPSQETSFWYRRRLETYERPPQDDPSQDDSGAWSLFRRNTEASVPETLLLYWDPLKLENLKQWQPELMALIISISSFAGIVGLLAKYNGKLQPDFADQISINALIAVFSTILRATLLFVISEVIGELKWEWMEHPRPLRDIERFINATTGPWGSLKFLFFSWKPFVILTILGAIVVIASPAIGPFSQQASATYTCYQTSPNTAEILITRNVSTLITPEMRGVAVNGLMYGSANISIATSSLFGCAVGNCSFDESNGITHTSAGLCSNCVEPADRSAENNGVENSDKQLRISFNGDRNSSYVLDMRANFTSMPGLGGSSKYLTPAIFGSLRGENMTVFVRALTMSSSSRDLRSYSTRRDAGTGVLAIDCAIYPCSRTYHGKVVNNTLHESIVSESPLSYATKPANDDDEADDTNIGGFMKFIEPCCLTRSSYDNKSSETLCFDSTNISTASTIPSFKHGYNWSNWTKWDMNNGKMSRLPNQCVETFSPDTYGSIQDFINKTIVGSCSVSDKDSDDQRDKVQAAECDGKWWINSVFKEGHASLGSVDKAFDGMATSVTNLMRTTGLDGDGLPRGRVSGSSSKPAICIKAYWAWLLYPGLLLLLTTVLFWMAHLKRNAFGRQRPIWKSNVLPLIFYGIKPPTPSEDQNAETCANVPWLSLAELETVANNTVVQFKSEEDVPGFVTQEGERSLEKALTRVKDGRVSTLEANCTWPQDSPNGSRFPLAGDTSDQGTLRSDQLPAESLGSAQETWTWRNTILDWWQELLCCLISVICVICLAAVLSHFNNEPLPDWPLGLTLNGIIALLATLARAEFIVPISESISQIKWIWFRKERPLADFQDFDAASRGPWGSIKLLKTTRGGIPSLISTIVLVTAVLTSALTQLIVTYPVRLAETFPQPVLSRAIDTKAFETTTETANYGILSGLYHDSETQFPYGQPSCSATECHWNNFNTLGICVQLINVTDSLETFDGKQPSVKLSNAISTNYYSGKLFLFGLYKNSVPVLPDSSRPKSELFSFDIIYAMTETSTRAYKATLYYCVQTYDISVNGSEVSQRLIKTTVDPVTTQAADDSDQGGLRVPDEPETTFLYDKTGTNILVRLNDTLEGGTLAVTIGYGAAQRFAKAMDMETIGPINCALDESKQEAIFNVTDNIARALTYVMFTQSATVTGQAFTSHTYVLVRWPWLAFILIQIAFSIVLLAVAIVQTRAARLGVIKSSTLPAFFAISSHDKGLLEKRFAAGWQQDEVVNMVKNGPSAGWSLQLTERGWTLRR
ncbi:hypothetical protein CcaCcLH18_02340 [Colletotrichum camelliae]|nr:hypothetical protein CcaCcLH18_02340 [Colletotrichum camelliae]